MRNKIIYILNKSGIGTKNLPDAIEWHCAYYWNHALRSKQINKLKKTRDILKQSIAIPMWLKKTSEDYRKLGIKIKLACNTKY